MIKKSLYVICTASLLSASATMCYKKDHLDPSTIETVALSGGECKDAYSVEDMKKNGYAVDSMKIQNGTNGFNYIYVFQKDTPQNLQLLSATGNITDDELMQRLEKIQTKQVEIKKEEQRITTMANGKNLYESTCKRCHGDGSISAYNLARPLKEMSLEEMEIAMRDYQVGGKDNGMAILMQPYATLVTKKDIEGIYNYLQTIK